MIGRLFKHIVISKIIPFFKRHPAVIILLGALYIIFPIDLIPEAFTGIFGYIDDLFALVFSMIIFQKFSQKKEAPQTTGPKKYLDPYKILDVSPSASMDEITQAYRKKMTLYHPDKVAHLGEELQEKAKEKSLEIQTAYQTLSSKKN